MYPKITGALQISPKILVAIGLVTLVACAGPQMTTTTLTDEKPDRMCVAGFVEDSPGKGTLDIFYASNYAPDVQSIEGVSIEVAEEITNQLGRC